MEHEYGLAGRKSRAKSLRGTMGICTGRDNRKEWHTQARGLFREDWMAADETRAVYKLPQMLQESAKNLACR
jgi:hypothetical protein